MHEQEEIQDSERADKHQGTFARLAITFAAFLLAGLLLPGGCSASVMAVRVDATAAAVVLALDAIGSMAVLFLLWLQSERRAAIYGLGCGVCAAVLLLSLAWVPASDWYYMKRCREGSSDACEQACQRGSARPERENFYAPRRACTLGGVYGCSVMLAYKPEQAVETCASLKRICAGKIDVSPATRKIGCDMVKNHCGGVDTATTP